jgi:hypothetical protein
MITIYSEKNIFEDVILSKDKYPNLNPIFIKHANICLNISNEEYWIDSQEGTIMFEYLKMKGRRPIALKDYFEELYENNEIIINKPRSLFFLKYSKEEAGLLQSQYGIIVQSESSINDSILKDSKEDILEEKSKSTWGDVFNFKMPPMNSVVLNDRYLFKNEEHNKNTGIENAVKLFNKILPKTLDVDFHITILTDNDKLSAHFDEQNLSKRIKKVRPYNIQIEFILLIKALHARVLLSNYIYSTFDPGLAVFSNKTSEVRERTKYDISRTFSNIGSSGKSKYDLLDADLNEIKISKLKGIKSNNRLINDV